MDCQFVSRRRTRDLFVDHMLQQHGYRVLRIDDVQDAAGRQALVARIRSALRAPAGQPRSQADPEQDRASREPACAAQASAEAPAPC